MKHLTNFMIDFETWATTPKALVRCLSIVPFKLEREESIEDIMARTLTVWFDPAEQIQRGRELDDETLAWWEKNTERGSEEARQNAHIVLGRSSEDAAVADALEVVFAYVHDVAPDGLIYSRGSNFDFPILEDLCRSYNVTFPFSTWKLTCSKSILRFVCQDDKELESDIVGGLKSNHCSAYDCAVEVKKLQAIFAAVHGE